jgi:hypothetical protein
MLITSDIIARYNLQVDDASELSSDEELALANEVYNAICNDRPWEWLKKTYTGVTSITVSYVALPSDFKELSPNRDNKSVIFVGTDRSEYIVVPLSSRRDYYNTDGYCYIDIPNQRLYFMKQPTSVEAIEYDYVSYPAALTLATSPVFNSTYHPMIAYGMAAKFSNIDQEDKTKSYKNDNKKEYDDFMFDLRIEDANIKLAM